MNVFTGPFTDETKDPTHFRNLTYPACRVAVLGRLATALVRMAVAHYTFGTEFGVNSRSLRILTYPYLRSQPLFD
jgi:hypothetical protein